MSWGCDHIRPSWRQFSSCTQRQRYCCSGLFGGARVTCWLSPPRHCCWAWVGERTISFGHSRSAFKGRSSSGYSRSIFWMLVHPDALGSSQPRGQSCCRWQAPEWGLPSSPLSAWSWLWIGLAAADCLYSACHCWLCGLVLVPRKAARSRGAEFTCANDPGVAGTVHCIRSGRSGGGGCWGWHSVQRVGGVCRPHSIGLRCSIRKLAAPRQSGTGSGCRSDRRIRSRWACAGPDGRVCGGGRTAVRIRSSDIRNSHRHRRRGPGSLATAFWFRRWSWLEASLSQAIWWHRGQQSLSGTASRRRKTSNCRQSTRFETLPASTPQSHRTLCLCRS